jgi:hypothetical protein
MHPEIGRVLSVRLSELRLDIFKKSFEKTKNILASSRAVEC